MPEHRAIPCEGVAGVVRDQQHPSFRHVPDAGRLHAQPVAIDEGHRDQQRTRVLGIEAEGVIAVGVEARGNPRDALIDLARDRPHRPREPALPGAAARAGTRQGDHAPCRSCQLRAQEARAADPRPRRRPPRRRPRGVRRPGTRPRRREGCAPPRGGPRRAAPPRARAPRRAAPGGRARRRARGRRPRAWRGRDPGADAHPSMPPLRRRGGCARRDRAPAALPSRSRARRCARPGRRRGRARRATAASRASAARAGSRSSASRRASRAGVEGPVPSQSGASATKPSRASRSHTSRVKSPSPSAS